MKAEELTDPGLPLDDLVWQLFHEEECSCGRSPAIKALSRGCRCDPDYVRSVIARVFRPRSARRWSATMG